MEARINAACQFFASAFAESFANVLNQAGESRWNVEVVEKNNLATRQGPPFHVRLTIDGAVRGDCFVEVNRSEAALIASHVFGKPAGVFDEEHAQAVTKAIDSAMTELVASLSPEYGMLTVQVDAATGIAPGAMHIVPLTASNGGAEPISILLYFSGQLVNGLSPQPPAKPRAEKDAPQTSSLVDPMNLNLVLDVELNVTLRFGQRHLPLREVLQLGSGSVIELDHQVDDPVELLLDGKVIARGEAVIVDGNYGLRITEIPNPMTSKLIH